MRLRIEQNIGEMFLFRAKIESKIRKGKTEVLNESLNAVIGLPFPSP